MNMVDLCFKTWFWIMVFVKVGAAARPILREDGTLVS